MIESRKPLDYWLPPEDAGKPLACLATSFSFEVDFFEQQCLGRFLGLDWKRDEGDDLAFLIEQEEKLAEARVSVIVDRAWATEGRSLRWDLLPIGVKGGVMHAKVSLLIWEHLVRCMVGSANLTSAGYRRQLEAQLVLDATAESGPPSSVVTELLDALRRLVLRGPGSRHVPGPKQTALATLEDAERRLVEFGERRPRRGDPRIAIVPSEPRQPVLDGFDRVWRGGPPRKATVLSPFFDSDGEETADALSQRLATRGRSQVKFVVKADQPTSGSKVRVQAPPSLLDSLPDRVDRELCSLRQTAEEEFRGLHAKAILLESDTHSALLIGSSNFTRAGLGLGNPANLEVNVAIGARKGSETGRAMARLIPIGDPIDPEDADWEPEEADDEPEQPELPWGFVQALVDPAPPATLRLSVYPKELPSSWTVFSLEGAILADSDGWREAGSPDELRIPLAGDALPYCVKVTWAHAGNELSAKWPVNVTDKVALPPPEKLRTLSVDALLMALASTRPLHEGVIEAMKTTGEEGGPADDLDPLARFSETGQLMRRARQASQAFAGLRTRLERPAATEEALIWRLEGPFGPSAIANGLIERAEAGGDVAGETSFLLAELALTLSRVDWTESGRLLRGGTRIARRHARKALDELRELRDEAAEDKRLAEYVERAFAEAKL